MTAKVIAICNQKGGTSKTTTSANLGIGLARHDKSAVCIDLDPQGDLTTVLGWKNGDDIYPTIATLIEGVMTERPMDARSAILNHAEGIDLIPANIELSDMEMRLVTAMSREFTLKECLKGLKDDYDYIIIDCPPSLSMITINALTAADSVIIPVQAHYLSAKGMTQLVKTINRVKKQLNPALKIDGVLLTLSDNRTNFARQTASFLRENYGHVMKIYDNVIPLAAKAAETSAIGKSIFAHDEHGKAANAYAGFVQEVVDDGDKLRLRASLSR